MKSVRDMNSMITVLFDALADERIRQNTQSMKSQADESAIATLQTGIEVCAARDKGRDSNWRGTR